MVSTMSLVDQEQNRFRRAWINFMSDIKEKKVSANHGATINMDSTHSNTSNKEADHWLNMIKYQGGRVMQGGTDLILTPVSWLTTITNNWYTNLSNFVYLYAKFFFLLLV
ncbi:unnamed protein product [Rotaria sp. Silwood2]|nr:unnamed protein product [Rotaria sp. Silwood2]CAF4847318.1 unnamed protein product [Rotaria sp. Silwood2]